MDGTDTNNEAQRADLARALRLAQLSLAFGRVERATRHEDGVHVETDTDHTVMLGLVACELAPAGLDRAKVAAFALVHDLAEVYAGDTQTLTITPAGMAAKHAREYAARTRLASELGEGSWIARTLSIYEEQREPEARFVRAMDKVLPKLTHAFNACAAALPLTDRAGFFEAHERQYRKLSEEYPEFPEVLELLRLSMRHAEERWPERAPASPPERDNAATEAFDAIAAACGCPHWDYPGQVVRDVQALAAERDALLALCERFGGEDGVICNGYEDDSGCGGCGANANHSDADPANHAPDCVRLAGRQLAAKIRARLEGRG